MDYLETMQSAFFDELESIGMEKEATAGAAYQGVKALGGKLLTGANTGQMAKFLGARAGIGAGVGAVAGGATSREGNFGRGMVRGALAGGAIGAGVGGAQLGRAAYRVGRASTAGRAVPQAAYSTLRRAGVAREGVRGLHKAAPSTNWKG